MSLGPLPPVPNWLRVVIEGEIDNEDVYPWANVLHFEFAGTHPSNAVCATLAGDISAAWGTHMAPECPSPTQLTKVTVTDLTSDTSGSGEWLGNIVGTRGDDGIPANAAMLVSYPATLRYRGGHPRQYLYIGGNADFEGSAKWSTLFTAEGESHWRAFLAAVEGLSASGTALGSFGAIRYYGKFLPNSGPPRYRLDTPLPMVIDITQAVTAQEIASQRRRIGRRKR